MKDNYQIKGEELIGNRFGVHSRASKKIKGGISKTIGTGRDSAVKDID